MKFKISANMPSFIPQVEGFRRHLTLQSIASKGVVSVLEVDLVNSKGGLKNFEKVLRLYLQKYRIPFPDSESLSTVWYDNQNRLIQEEVILEEIATDIYHALIFFENLASILSPSKMKEFDNDLYERYSSHTNKNDMNRLRPHDKILFSRYYGYHKCFKEVKKLILSKFSGLSFNQVAQKLYIHLQLLSSATDHLAFFIDKNNPAEISSLPDLIETNHPVSYLGINQKKELATSCYLRLSYNEMVQIRRISIQTGIPISLPLQYLMTLNKPIRGKIAQTHSSDRYKILAINLFYAIKQKTRLL